MSRKFYCCLDIETKHLIPKGKVLRDLLEEHGEGFDPVAYLGIARLGLKIRYLQPPYNTEVRLYSDDPKRLQEAAAILDQAEFVTGWNIGEYPHLEDGFDLNLLSKFVEVNVRATFDLMRVVQRCSGYFKFYKLEEVAQTTLGRGKLGSGAEAPGLFAEGKHDALDSYLVGDIDLEESLCWFALNNGFVLAPDGKAVFLEFEPYLSKRSAAWSTNWKGPAEVKQWEELKRYWDIEQEETQEEYYTRIKPELQKYAIGDHYPPTKGELYGLLKNVRKAEKQGRLK